MAAGKLRKHDESQLNAFMAKAVGDLGADPSNRRCFRKIEDSAISGGSLSARSRVECGA